MTVKTGVLDQVRISGVASFEHVTRRNKLIGKNAKKDVHGWEARETVVRLFTDGGIDGIGFGQIERSTAGQLVGQRVSDLWDPEKGSIGLLGRADHALFDLVGKIVGLPAWKLLGARGPEWVPVYDGSIYFSDLLPEHQKAGVGRILDEVETGLHNGHRAFKIKVGRGGKWLGREEGLAKDIEVVLAVSEFCGSEIKLMADGNDQLGFSNCKSLLEACGHCLEFIEEPFPENERASCELREWIAHRGLKTKLADGETEHDPVKLRHLATIGALDVVQPDIRAHGLSLQKRLSEELDELPGVCLASHNWGSYLGNYHMLQLGRGISNFLIAEIDHSESDLFDSGGWRLEEGRIRVPDEVGCGLQVKEDVYRARYLPRAWRAGDVPGI
jgi:D-galactarolactone cycloisomerase